MPRNLLTRSEAHIDLLIETVEDIRSRNYPDIPPDIVQSILKNHEDLTKPDIELVRSLEDLVEQLVSGGE